MISAKHAGKLAEKFLSDNAPAILTSVGVVGVVTTAYLSGKGSFKAADAIREEEARRAMMGEPVLDTKGRVKLAWTHFLPAAGTTALTITCVVCANRISMGRAAAMATAYSLGEKRFKEYREKTAEMFGAKKAQDVQDGVAQDQVKNNPPGQNLVVLGGDVLFRDSLTGRYFKSSIEDIKKAQNDLNYQMNLNEYASLNDLYHEIGLEPVGFGEEVGWNSDHLIEITFSTVLADNNEPCIVMNYSVTPQRNYQVCKGDRRA